ncbi:unnamed protein product [Effrenium voratum]|uniref:tRNA-uridine aminocarboxypropyltransferase n=1 Tax=Effrenium voratum TaxID=2562239 RepID=A0AA36IYI8_9DINO|nr:unnamed protein product [Effrenium voratum]
MASVAVAPVAKRVLCEGCQRPVKLCLCECLPPEPVQTRTRIVVLVHPKEMRRKLGTLPLLRLCLKNLVIHEGDCFPEPEEDPELHAALLEEHQPMFLCPGPDAVELSEVPDSKSLILIDGTWRQAKSMVSRSEWLRQHVPRGVIRPQGYSGYRFRKQPEQGCLSTLEAVAEALLALEGPRGPELKDMLLAPFARMVEMQCSFIGDVADKNTPCEQTSCPFDPEAALMQLQEREAAEAKPGADEEVYCILRWGERALERPVIVVELIRSSSSDAAKRRAQELSLGRPKGSRCWFRLLSQVPPGALWEVPAGDAGDEEEET